MSPQRLALRTILRARPRSVVASLMIAASLSVLDLFAGHIASVRAQLEYQAVFGERLGHLAIFRSGTAHDGRPQSKAFGPAEAVRVKRIVAASAGVAGVMPQMSVSGIASTGKRSALFFGEGIGADVASPEVPELPGKLDPARRNGIALGSGQARSLGVSSGSKLTLTGVPPDAAPVPVDAQVVDVFSTEGLSAGARPLLMPFEMAQSLLYTERTERFVVFLSNPAELEERRMALLSALRVDGIDAEIRSWKDQSVAFGQQRSASDLAFDSVAGMVFAVIAATVAFTISMNALERRREVATLRALGMRTSSVFLMFSMEALWLAAIGIAISLVASGLIAWVVNRAALSYTTQHALGRTPMLVELDFNRMLMAVVTVLAVTLMAALLPSFKAARLGIAESMAK
ncbi:MAG: FtsX-like permease family protein [Telluria sp.]|nr:FtsX-like permease family protein [Telluria sp.]